MNLQVLENQLEELNHKLRIIILQNVREEDGYDEQFLCEMNKITKQILGLKHLLSKGVSQLNSSPNNQFEIPVTKH